MLTMNANSHPLMGPMHRAEIDPKAKLPLRPDIKNMRGVIAIEDGDVDRWLGGTVKDARALSQLTPVELS